MSKQKVARLASQPEDYQKLGIQKEVSLHEDGHRTNGKFGEYEWWYFLFAHAVYLFTIYSLDVIIVTPKRSLFNICAHLM